MLKDKVKPNILYFCTSQCPALIIGHPLKGTLPKGGDFAKDYVKVLTVLDFFHLDGGKEQSKLRNSPPRGLSY